MTLRPRLAAALAHAVLLTTVAIPPVLAPAAAVAQATQPERTVFAVRFMGEWEDDFGLQYVFTRENVGDLRGVVTRKSTGEQVAVITWGPHAGGMGGNFTSSQEAKGGITGYVDHLGGAALFVRAGAFPNGLTPSNGAFRLKRPASHRQSEKAALWIGTWRTSRGLLTLEREAGHVFGYIESGEPISRTQRIALDGDGGIVVGAWEKYGEWSPTVERGDVWLQISADEKSFRGFYTDVNRTGARRIDWTGQRADQPQRPQGPAQRPPAERAPAATAEQTALGRKLQGVWREASGPSLWNFRLDQRGSGSAVTWHQVDTESTGGVAAMISPASDGRRLAGKLPDGKAFFVETNELGEVHLIYDGQGGSTFSSMELLRRPLTPDPVRDPVSPQPQPQPQPGSGTPPAQPGPVAGFKPLNRVHVRLDRVIVARGYPTHQVHAFLTVKNTSASPQYFTSGFMKVVLADADGVSWERSQPYRASGEPAELFASTPVIQPGGELKVRYVFVPEVDARLTSLTLSEGDKRAEFPVGGL